MLRFSQSASSSSSSAATNHMDLSVLDRQRAVFQRLYQSDSWQQNHEIHHSDLHSVIDRQHMLSQFLHIDHQSQMATTSNSSLSMAPIPKPYWQCNSSLSPNKEDKIYSSNKKRKAEFDVVDEIKGKVVVEPEETGEEKSEITTKTERGISSNTFSKTSSKASEVKKPDYIHVRARRGQATDNHSLAERARREKISKKMKCLQDLVPGCHKVTGKAGMLDEIINYVQSLQKQVEFLSMKLATVNPSLDFSIDNIFAKEMPAYLASLPTPPAQFESANSTCFNYNTMQQGCGTDMAMDQSPQVFPDSSFISQLQQLSGWESDWPNLFN